MRFAPLIRVSTLKQADRGNSLKLQTKNIIKNVKNLNGTIPSNLLTKYSGQEHATPGRKRKQFDQLF